MKNELAIASGIRAFNEAKRDHPSLERFESPEHLVDWLLDYPGHTTEDEDEILRTLRRLHLAGVSPTLWLAILLLGLWPPMEWAFCRIRRLYASDAEAASSIWDAVCDRLCYEPLWERQGVAKRLMYAAWTRSRRFALKQVRSKRREVSLDRFLQLVDSDDDDKDDDDEHDPKRPAYMEPSHNPNIDDCFSVTPDELKSRLVDAIGMSPSDAEILIDHIVLGKSLAEMARAEGISPAAIRKRFQRAKRRLRDAAKDFSKNPVTFLNLGDLGIQRGNSPSPSTRGGDT